MSNLPAVCWIAGPRSCRCATLGMDAALSTQVICYAGARYPERPRAFLYEDKRLEVVDVQRQERTPRHVRFLVRVKGGRRFWLYYDQGRDAWEVQEVRPRPQGEGDLAWRS